MPENDAEEITIVLKDGTVYRYTGEAASDLWSGIRRAEGEYLDLSMSLPTTTKSKPLRKVTEDWNCAFGHSCHYIYDTQTSSNAAWKMDDICPPEALSRPGRPPKLFRFRFVVEAVPVEEKGR